MQIPAKTNYAIRALLFVAVNVGSWFFVQTFVPETKGTTLEELEERFEAEGVQAVATV